MYQQPQPQQPPMPYAPDFNQGGFPPQPPPQHPFYGGPPMMADPPGTVAETQASGMIISSVLSIYYCMDLYETYKEFFDSDHYRFYSYVHFKGDFRTFVGSLPMIFFFSFFLSIMFMPNFFNSNKSPGHKMWLILAGVIVHLFQANMNLTGVLTQLAIVILIYLCYADDSKYPFAQSLRPWTTPIENKSD